MGDMHVDDLDDTDAVDFNTTTEALGLDQHVNFFTHNKGHILDLVLAPHITKLAVLRTIPGPFFSDHRAIICTVGLQWPKFLCEEITFRKYKDIDIGSFGPILEAMLQHLDVQDTPLDHLATQV